MPRSSSLAYAAAARLRAGSSTRLTGSAYAPRAELA
eukprot:gene10745-15674_t